MGRRGYTAEFRQRVLDLVAAGRRVEDIARDLGISDQTVYSWRRQHRVDRGLEMGSVGDCFDNAVMEAFWSRVRVELLDRKRWSSR